MGIVTAVAAIAGLGLSAAGAAQQSSAAKASASFQQQQISAEQQQAALQQQAMELDARRRQTEVIRNQQRSRSLSLATATAQGAEFGSALGGAYGGISGQSGVNALGINQQLQFGQQNFGLNNQISAARIGMAGAQGDYSTGGSLMSLGNSLVSNLGTIGRIGAGFGDINNLFASNSSSGSVVPSGYNGNNPYAIY